MRFFYFVIGMVLVSSLLASQVFAQEPPFPPIAAKAYLVGELRTGRVIAKQNVEAKLPIASLTKLITAIVATERLNPEQEIAITDQILATEGDAGGLWRGERWLVKDLLAALLLESSNDAAVALASALPAKAFVAAMNDKAQQLGLTNTTFVDPSGLSPRNRSTAQDLLKLTQALQERYPNLLELSRQPAAQPTPTGSFTHFLKNFNGYAGQTWFIGGKIGFLPEAKQTYLGVFQLGSEPVAIIVLGTNDRFLQTNTLLAAAAKQAQVPLVIPNNCAEKAKLASRHVTNTCLLAPNHTTGKAIEINLGNAKLRLYQDGQLQAEYWLSGKPTTDSSQRIQTGVRRIAVKEKNKKISPTQLRAHYALTLDNGVRFISWPLRGSWFLPPSRLTMANALILGSRQRKKLDAQAIYDFVEEGTPVVIYE